MIAVRVRLLHGWARASGRSDAALMGTLPGGGAEWPLSPARLFAALVSGGGTGATRRLIGDDSELRALESASPPLILADRDRDVLMNDLVERFVVQDTNAKGSVQEYPARKSATNRPGVRICPRSPHVTYIWPDLDLSDRQFSALQMRAARVGYVGASDAPAQVTVVRSFQLEEDDVWTPDTAGSESLNVPSPGFLDALDRAYEEFCAGQYRTGATIFRQAARYRPPGAHELKQAPRPTLIWCRLDRAVSGQRVVDLAESVKGLILASFPSREAEDSAPAVIHGHGLAPGQDRVRFWPLPNVGPHGNGRLFGVCVSLPAGTDPALVQQVEAVLDDAELRLPKGGTTRKLSLFSGEPGPSSASPRKWIRPSRQWTSATPVVFDRYRKRGPSASDVAELCARAGFPEPEEYEVARVPLIEGGVDLPPYRTIRKGARGFPYGHLRLRFTERLDGPLVLGRMRTFGLGLMTPVDGSEATARPRQSLEVLR